MSFKSLTGAEAAQRIRALRQSGDFEEYWRFHEAQEYERNHAARYANRTPPATQRPRPPPPPPPLPLPP